VSESLPVRTPRLVLRPFAAGDLDAFAAYRADPAVAAYQSWDAGYSRADAERFLAEQERLALGAPGEWVQVAIADARDDALLGDCACRILAHEPRTAEVGITLAPASQGRGVAREAVSALLGVLFGELGMHRVIAYADDRNRAVQHLLGGLGFRLEGRHVEADWFKGHWTTLRLYALLAREHAR